MSSDIEVAAKLREAKGSNQVRKIRQEGWIPAVVYSGIQETTPIQIDEHDFELMLSKHGSESMMIGLSIDGGKSTQVLLKEVQHHPIDGHVLHVDFHAVDVSKKLSVNIPIELVGEAKGVVEGGVLDHSMREVEVECLPADIVEQFEVDVSGLGIGENLTVADLDIDSEKYTILSEPELAVASVVPPRKLEEEVETEEGAVEQGAAEPEVIGEEAAEAADEAGGEEEEQ